MVQRIYVQQNIMDMTNQNNTKKYTAEEMQEMKREARERLNKPAVKEVLFKSLFPAIEKLADE